VSYLDISAYLKDDPAILRKFLEKKAFM